MEHKLSWKLTSYMMAWVAISFRSKSGNMKAGKIPKTHDMMLELEFTAIF
jgi:hypothetical protein